MKLDTILLVILAIIWIGLSFYFANQILNGGTCPTSTSDYTYSCHRGFLDVSKMAVVLGIPGEIIILIIIIYAFIKPSTL